MALLLLFLTAACDDDALAGAAYREALEATRLERYEEAIARLQEALRNQPKETDKLLYRDRDGRHKDPYYPHYTWSQIRAIQARKEQGPSRQRELFREAIAHLELTTHPGAAGTVEEVRTELAAVEQMLATRVTTDAAIPALRLRIEQLCDLEKLEEAERLVVLEKALLDRHPAERTRLRETLDLRRAAALARYEKAMDLALERVAIASPLDEPEAIPELLRSALLPPSVAAPAEGRFVWLRDFLSRCESLRADTEDPSPFEEAAAGAVRSGTFTGFRAARNIAQAIRLRRIETREPGRDDAELDRLLAGARDSASRCRELIAGRKEFENFLTTGLTTFQDRVQKAADRLAERKKFGEDLGGWLARADAVLAESASMADPEVLRSAARAFDPLETGKGWETAPAAVRARALMNRGILELVALLLEGETVVTAVDRVAPRLRAARSLDPAVTAIAERRLSPRIRAQIGR